MRWMHDKSGMAYLAGDIGRLQTARTYYVMAGETLSVDYTTNIRLSELRRPLMLEAQVDFYAFYQPVRHAYGDDWVNFIKAGPNESITFTNGPAQTPANYLGFRPLGSGNFPLPIVTMYNRVWNEYFRAPSDTAGIRTDTVLEGDARGQMFGALIGRLPTPWSTGIDGEPAASEREVASATVVDLLDLAEVKAKYKTEEEIAYFENRYRDRLSRSWGGRASPDVEQRPTLLGHKTMTLSGVDIDGTADANLGTFSGKSAGVFNFRLPPKWFPEHGHVMIMVSVRFPTVFQQEADYLLNNPNPSYLEAAGDTDLIAAQGPESVTADKFFSTTSATDYGHAPYGQFLRHSGNFVHQKYVNLFGFPFISSPPATAAQARYHVSNEYANTFGNDELGQWNAQGYLRVVSKNSVPPAANSIFAGT